jgi:hypothetical protein
VALDPCLTVCCPAKFRLFLLGKGSSWGSKTFPSSFASGILLLFRKSNAQQNVPSVEIVKFILLDVSSPDLMILEQGMKCCQYNCSNF